jgi:hypothetical protein
MKSRAMPLEVANVREVLTFAQLVAVAKPHEITYRKYLVHSMRRALHKMWVMVSCLLVIRTDIAS